MSDFNTQLYSGIALQNADELTGNNAKDKLLAYLGTEAGTLLLAELFKTKLNTPKLPLGKPSLNASPSEFFGMPEIKLNTVLPMLPKLALPTSMLQLNPLQFFNLNTSTNTVLPTNTSTSIVLPTLNLALNANFNYTSTQLGSMNQAVQNATDRLTSSSSSSSKPIFSKDALVSGGAGIAGGAVGLFAGNKLGGLLFDSNTKEGAFASGLLGLAGSTVAATAASNLASSGSLSLSGIGSAASIGLGAMGVANIALDAFDPMKKSKAENIAGLGLGAVGAAAALASVPVAGWVAGGALLATNALGHALGRKTNSFTMDRELYSRMGAAYGSSMRKALEAERNANKKVSGFNTGELNRMNRKIAEASQEMQDVAWIDLNATDRKNIAQYMSAFNGLRRGYLLQGSYDLSAIHVAKNGIKIEKLNKAKEILKSLREELTNLLQKGGEIKLNDFEYYLSTLPENQRDSTNFRVKDYWIFNGKPKDFQEAINREMFSLQEDFDDNGKSLGFSWHANTIAWNPETGEGEFMKSPNHKTILKEIDWYNSKDGENFRRLYTLVKSTPYWKYVKKHEGGGSIIKIISDIEMFLKGGTLSQKVKDYYNGYDLSNVTLVNDSSPRTEGSIIYSPSDEYTVHELWHYLSQNKPNEALKEFYDLLDDTKLLKFGADLKFVKRTGDPGDFYNPSELEARLKAAKFMSLGSLYDKEFFRNLRGDENRYGDNMRDLLRMFDDDHLERLFNVLPKFLNGGSINVIPEGALHARKNNMDMDGITKKGIPVVDKEGELLAEIERNEVILRLEVTQKLEELSKIYYSEEASEEEKELAALDAGKLLSDEILYNTLDNTGLLNGNKK